MQNIQKNKEKRVQNAMNKRIKSEKSHQPINALYNYYVILLTNQLKSG